jgi:hypothetical protein
MGSVIFKKGELVAFLDLNHTDSLKVSTFVVVVSIRGNAQMFDNYKKD